jgi:hypothetical protein
MAWAVRSVMPAAAAMSRIRAPAAPPLPGSINGTVVGLLGLVISALAWAGAADD